MQKKHNKKQINENSILNNETSICRERRPRRSEGRNTQKGITLIALIITIIVLLILAVVSIRLVMNNGILGKAESAVSKYSDSEINEKIQLAYSELQMEQISNPNVDAVTFLKISLEKQGLTGVDVVPNGDRWDIKIGEKTYTLASTGSILDWSKTLANATKHEEQSSTNTDIGIDMYGNPVNLDLWTYTLNESEKTFCTSKEGGCNPGPGYVGEITSEGKIIGEIPQYIKKDNEAYLLTSLFNGFYNRNTLVTAPSIPNSVTSVSRTFSGCKSLTQAPEIPNSVTNMGSTFYYCTSLTQAPEIPSSVTQMSYTFAYCTSMQVPEIPNTVTNINGFFAGWTSLTQAPEIPNSVTNMDSTFWECTSLTQAPVIPDSVTNMQRTFYECTSLTQAPEIPNSVTNMAETFCDCASLTQAPEIPNSVTNMWRTFWKCTSLTQAPEIPNSVTNMGSTFYRCFSLVRAPVIPDSVTSLDGTFEYCTSLTGTLTINASYVKYYYDCLMGAATNVGTNLVVTGSCPQLDAIIATKSTNSNITKGN